MYDRILYIKDGLAYDVMRDTFWIRNRRGKTIHLAGYENYPQALKILNNSKNR